MFAVAHLEKDRNRSRARIGTKWQPAELFGAKSPVKVPKRLGLSQTEMAVRIGMTLRLYQSLESGGAEILSRHVLATERAALSLALERGNPIFAPAPVRREALELARLITG